MPYVRIFTPDLSLDDKRSLAQELTEIIFTVIPDQPRTWTTIHFFPLSLENVAVGGRMVSDTNEPEYHLEFGAPALGRSKKERLVQEITPVMMRRLGLTREQAYRINITFYDYGPHDVAVGGRFATQFQEGGPGEAPPRGGFGAHA
jgi:phenylpyruvate tautomerase PptA (4-oxalocrotonate tautomerase family)